MSGGTRARRRRARLHRRPRCHRPPSETTTHRDGVPELRGVSAHEGVRQHRLRAQDAEGEEAGDRRASALGGQLLHIEEPARPLLVPAVGRAEAARGRGPGNGHESGRAADGRAALEPRRPAPSRDARRAQVAAPEPRRDDDLRHARPDRGAQHGRPDRRDEQGARSSSSAIRSRCTTTRPTRSSAASSATRR